MQWDKLEQPSDADIQALAQRQNHKKGLFAGSRENNTLTLEINEGTISDVGLTLISQFPDLEDLTLFDEPEVDERTFRITSAGWQVLSTCKRLRRLSLINCPLMVADARCLGSMRDLDSLTLTRCDLTDEHIQALTPLSKLTYLCLNYNHLTDGSIAYFISFRRLKILHLAHTRFSAPGASELKEILSKCEVQFT